MDLLKADREVEARVARELPATLRLNDIEDFRAYQLELLQVAKVQGHRALPVLIRKIVQDFQSLPKNKSVIESFWNDELFYPFFVHLRGLSQKEFPLSVLSGLLRDPGIHVNLRVGAAIALLWRGHSCAFSRALECIEDNQAPIALRRAILFRLPRLALPLPARFKDLLYFPFQDIDLTAASVLAITGDAEAPSLLMAALSPQHSDLQLQYCAILGVEALTKHGVLARPPKYHYVPQHYLALARDNMEKWMTSKESAGTTAFEARRRHFYAKFEATEPKNPRNFMHVLLSTKGDIDFAGAALLFSPLHLQKETLERLDRLSFLAGRRIREADTPRQTIAMLCKLCLGPVGTTYDPEIGHRPYSCLDAIFRDGRGNCLGYSSLLVALGERLRLPLYAVMLPQHVFVRYDDGDARFNIETISNGVAISDDAYQNYIAGRRVPRHDSQPPVFLRNLTKRHTLSLIYDSVANRLLEQRDFQSAYRVADSALELWPRNYLAWVNRSRACFELAECTTDSAIDGILKGLDVYSESAYHFLMIGELLLRSERYSEAVEFLRKAQVLDRRDPRPVIALIRGLSLAGRPEAAFLALDEAKKTGILHKDEICILEVEVHVRQDRSAVRDILTRIRTLSGFSRKAATLAVAEALLEPVPQSIETTEMAIAILKSIKAGSVSEDDSTKGKAKDSRITPLRQGLSMVFPKTSWDVLERCDLLLIRGLKYCGRSREAEAALRMLATRSRKTCRREVRVLLRGGSPEKKQ